MFIYTMGDAIGVGLALIILVFSICAVVRSARRQRRCKHERHFETSACQAICRDCGKDLGFIATWRKQQRAKD